MGSKPTTLCWQRESRKRCEQVSRGDCNIIDGEGSYNDLEKNYKITYVAGGAAQNAARGAQVRPHH